MIVTVLKSGYRKKGPKIITYRNYANFCAEDFRKDLCDQISSESETQKHYKPTNLVWRKFRAKN